MKKVIILVLLLVVGTSPSVSADNIDVSGALNSVYSVSLDGAPDDSGIVVLFDWTTRNQNEKTDHKGDMNAVGDYEVWDGRLSSVLLGLGYKVGPITPWVGGAGQSTKVTKYEMKLEDGKLNKVTTDVSKSIKGVAFGVSAEHWVERWGVAGTVAKMPEGIIANARLKYKITGIGTAHIGYVYSGYVGHGIVAGLGLTY